jgi:hypothetical protein
VVAAVAVVGVAFRLVDPVVRRRSERCEQVVDVAFACLDLTSNIISSMPVCRLRNSNIIEPTTWMTNPDPTIYTSWNEFAKRSGGITRWVKRSSADGERGGPLPFDVPVMPPWLIHVEMRERAAAISGGTNGRDVTDDILHIRYKSTIDNARGVGLLEMRGWPDGGDDAETLCQ